MDKKKTKKKTKEINKTEYTPKIYDTYKGIDRDYAGTILKLSSEKTN